VLVGATLVMLLGAAVFGVLCLKIIAGEPLSI